MKKCLILFITGKGKLDFKNNILYQIYIYLKCREIEIFGVKKSVRKQAFEFYFWCYINWCDFFDWNFQSLQKLKKHVPFGLISPRQVLKNMHRYVWNITHIVISKSKTNKSFRCVLEKNKHLPIIRFCLYTADETQCKKLIFKKNDKFLRHNME